MNKYDHLSYSSISKFVTCPLQFSFYMNNKKALPSESALAGKDRHEDIARQLALGSFEQSKFGDRMKGFCRHILKVPTAIERDFAMDFVTNTVVGKIDAYSVHANCAIVVDWKSNPGYDNPLQLEIYSLALRELHPEIEIVHAYFFYTGPDYYQSYTYFAEDLDRFSVELSQTIDAISTAEKFEPRPGPHCSKCSYVESCPVAKNFEIVKIGSAESAIELAQKTYAVEALLDKAKDRIKSWIIEHGLESIPTGQDSRYYLSSSTSLRSGKFKSDKDREACNKALELATAKTAADANTNGNQPIVNKQECQADPQVNTEISASGSKENISSASNIIAFELQQEKTERVKMSELVELLKKTGRLPQDATSADGSRVIRELIGVPFISASEQQKRELRDRLLSESAA